MSIKEELAKELPATTLYPNAPSASAPTAGPPIQAFSSIANFEIAQRMSKALAESDLVPQIYRKNMSNCLVALEIAQRCQASVLMVMQNLNIIQGKPSWSSQYIIAALNSCGKFSPLRFKMNEQKTECIAWALENKTSEVLEGPLVSIAMAKAEGWYDKNGSKWKTMPDVMLRYRAASFFGKLYAPEVLMGLQTKEEVEDFIETTGRDITPKDASNGNGSLKDQLKAAKPEKEKKPPKEVKSETNSDPTMFDNFK